MLKVSAKFTVVLALLLAHSLHARIFTCREGLELMAGGYQRQHDKDVAEVAQLMNNLAADLHFGGHFELRPHADPLQELSQVWGNYEQLHTAFFGPDLKWLQDPVTMTRMVQLRDRIQKMFQLPRYAERLGFVNGMFVATLNPEASEFYHPPSPQKMKKIQTVRVQAGRLVDERGKPLKRGKYTFILTKDQVLRMVPTSVQLFHSDLTTDNLVVMAGEMAVKADGTITYVDDRSGHFKPPRLLTTQFLDWLTHQGVSLDQVLLEHKAPDSSEASDFARIFKIQNAREAP